MSGKKSSVGSDAVVSREHAARILDEMCSEERKPSQLLIELRKSEPSLAQALDLYARVALGSVIQFGGMLSERHTVALSTELRMVGLVVARLLMDGYRELLSKDLPSLNQAG